MKRLLYFSTASADVTQADVDRIVQAASDANAQTEISGALAYNGRNFCQVLEGPDEQVSALMQRIEADNRHSGIKILDEKPITNRYFADWTMVAVDELDFSVVINAMNA